MRTSRRKFLGLSAATAGATFAAKPIFLDPEPLWAMPQAVAPSDRVRFGMIGIGIQGSGLMGTSITLAGVECDCLVAAVPDHWHKQIVVDAVNAGKDIYCEKPMSHSPADDVEMVAAAKKTGRIVQIGSQRVSSVVLAKARELVQQGVLDDLMMVEGVLGRNDPNGAWEYPPPPDLSPQNLDWDSWQGTVPRRALMPISLPADAVEGIWHRRRWRLAGPLGQRNDVCAGNY